MSNPFDEAYKNLTGSNTDIISPLAAPQPANPFDAAYSKYTGTNLGQPVKNLSSALNKQNDPNSSIYNGYCQQFVDDVLQTPPQNRMPSASDAWNNYAQNGQAKQGTKGIQPGDLIYFNDPNDSAGHVGIYTSSGKFISATQENPNQPVQNHSIAQWQDLTGDSILGYVKNPQNLPQIGDQPYGGK